MYNLLVDKFVKNNKNIKDSKVRKSYGTLASIFGIVTNIVLVVMKLVVGIITSSVSIIGDAINNLSDSASSIISLFGFKMSSKPADKDHPYGHGRMEYLAGLIVSVIVCVLGIELISSSINEIINKEKINSSIILTSIILVVSILIKLYQSFFYFKVSKTINSPTLKATSIDSRNDVIATLSVLIGLLISHFTGFNLDGYLGIFVGLLVMISGIKLVIETSSPLIGKAADKEFVNDLIKEIRSNHIVLGVHDLQIHSYGSFQIFGTCHVEVDANLNILMVHNQIDKIERNCNEKFNMQLVIHMDPIIIGDPLVDDIKSKCVAILDDLPIPYSIHDFRIINGPENINIVFDIVVPFDTKMKDEEIEEYIKKELSNINEKYQLILQIDKDYSSVDK